MKTIYNAVPSSLFIKMKSLVESENFPWYYYGNTATSSSTDGFSFAHLAYHKIGNSPYADVLECCFLSAIDKAEIKFKKLNLHI